MKGLGVLSTNKEKEGGNLSIGNRKHEAWWSFGHKQRRGGGGVACNTNKKKEGASRPQHINEKEEGAGNHSATHTWKRGRG